MAPRLEQLIDPAHTVLVTQECQRGVLRHLGVRTIVGVGVSINVGMASFVMDAVNAGYQFVLPRDAVAGVPPDYAESVIEHTLSLLATVVMTDQVLAECAS